MSGLTDERQAYGQKMRLVRSRYCGHVGGIVCELGESFLASNGVLRMYVGCVGKSTGEMQFGITVKVLSLSVYCLVCVKGVLQIPV